MKTYNVVMIDKPRDREFKRESILVDRVPFDTAKALVDKIKTILSYVMYDELVTTLVASDEHIRISELHRSNPGTLEIRIKENKPFDLDKDKLGGKQYESNR